MKTISQPLPAHPILSIDETIKEKGVVILENIHSLPITENPYLSPYCVIGVCNKGEATAIYDMRNVHYIEHDLAVTFPHHVLEPTSVSDDYDVTLVVISGKHAREMNLLLPFNNNIEYQSNPQFHLTDEQYAAIKQLINLLKYVLSLPTSTDDLLRSTLELCAKLIDHYRDFNRGDQATKFSKNQQIAIRFYDALTKNYRKSREVSFYADLLCLSPKYFGTIIRQATGKNASKWIANYVVMSANTMLRSTPYLTIQQISDKLGFALQADFCRYYKRETGISPKQYQKMYHR
ncbi:MAG: AraC family transcriptional regulator [Paludibacteraceae bacterium]|nr:AraC family transcriptional regulator [Paludibacteraceae bacterium]